MPASGHQIGATFVPVLIGVAIDAAVGPGDGRALLVWLAGLAVVYFVLSWSFRLGAYAGERAGARAAHGCGRRSWRGCWIPGAGPNGAGCRVRSPRSRRRTPAGWGR
ncbi:hypothetical protein ACFHW2_12560 [Actinomadura sp. LOL_016]|uniref:hypothetical protein n=1 Tax=unclassified Actinomadura TaxID=2626254 RepID=UPI003A7FFE7E